MPKTAAGLTSSELDEYRRHALLADEKARREEKTRRARAMAVARAGARLLKEEFGVRRVFVFGSLVAGARFHSRSDIDLAVEGLDPSVYWRADCRLEALGGDLEIDLVDLRTAPAHLATRIRRDGKEL